MWCSYRTKVSPDLRRAQVNPLCTQIHCLRTYGLAVPGHKSALAFGFLGSGDGVPVVAMLGRLHPYEGHTLSSVVYPIRIMAKLGVKDLIITNAVGSLNPSIPVGTSESSSIIYVSSVSSTS